MSWMRIALMFLLGSTIMGLGFGTSPLATPALADDDESVIEDTYVAPLDLDTSDEDVRDQGSSGFDTAGPVVVEPDYYESTNPDSDDSDSDDGE